MPLPEVFLYAICNQFLASLFHFLTAIGAFAKIPSGGIKKIDVFVDNLPIDIRLGY